MQVSNIKELDTHAVIGGGKAEAFGMSESAEFFTVLSDTLYRDKVRAVAREVICNAWDAHIMAGKTDQPIEIKLTNEELVIKDYGPGIAPERMRPIYCVYGASTKVADENQTGGFGLGSKAPFAYSDHFSVTSAYEGLRTVYAVSRGGAETDGKPDMRPMVQTPTKATGITVSIPIRSQQDRLDFENHVKAVVKQGGILATFNGDTMARNNYDPARKLGYMLTKQARNELRESVVYVLYGTVLYPLTTTNAEIMGLVSKVQRFLGDTRLILLAPANSVGVTPSRESLSYSEKTIKTCVDLLNQFTNSLRHDGALAVRENVKAKAKNIQRHNISLSVANETRGIAFDARFEAMDRNEIAKIVALAQPDMFTTTSERRRVLLAALGKKFRDSRRIFRRMAGSRSVDHRRNYSYYSECQREIYNFTRRLPLRLASRLGILSDLFVYEHGSTHRNKITGMDEYQGCAPVSQRILISPTQRDAIKFLIEERKLAVAARRKDDDLIVVYVAKKMSAEFRAKIEEQAKALKLTTEFLPFKERKKPKRGEKVEKKLYLAFSEVKSKDGYRFKIAETRTLAKAPKYYMSVRGGLDSIGIDRTFWEYRDALTKHYGEIALANNIKIEAKLKAAGARDIEPVMREDLMAISKTPVVAFSYLCKQGLLIEGGYYRSVSSLVQRMICHDPRFASFFFPEIKVKSSPLSEKSDFLTGVLHNNSYGSRSAEYRVTQEMWRQIRENAKKLFEGHIVKTKEEGDKRFGWLQPLADLGLSIDNEKVAYDEIVALLKWTKKRSEAKAKKIPENDNTVAAKKEAA